MASQRPLDWVSLLIARFEEQLNDYIIGNSDLYEIVMKNTDRLPLQKLPVGKSGQSSHVQVDLERSRDCLICVSKNLFSQVIYGLARILKKLNHETRSGSPTDVEKSLYKSQLVVLDTLEKCLSAQPKDTTRCDETMLVKSLLPEICQILNLSGDHPLAAQLKQSASRVLFALSLNNFTAVFSRISARLDALAKSSDESVEETDIELIQHLNVDCERLTRLLNETISTLCKFHPVPLKKNIMALLAVSLERAIWNWMDNYPEEFMRLHAYRQAENQNDLPWRKDLQDCCEKLFDLAENQPEMQSSKRKSSVWLLQVMLLVLSPVLLEEIVHAPHYAQLSPKQQQKKQFLDSLRKSLCSPGSNKQLTECAVVACVKLCKATSYISQPEKSVLNELVLPLLQDLKGSVNGSGQFQMLLFNPSKPFSRTGSTPTADVELMIECAVACFRIRASNSDHFQACLSRNAPPHFHLALVRALHTIVTKTNMKWWPKIDRLYNMAEDIRTLFSDVQSKVTSHCQGALRGSTQNLIQLTRNRMPVWRANKDRSSDDSSTLLLWLVRLVHADPKLMLHNPDRAGHEIQSSTWGLVMGLVSIMCQYSSLPDVSHEAMRALITLHQPENVELWNREAPIATFWDVSSQVLFRVSQKLVTHQIVNSTEVLQWLGEVLSLRNRFLNKYKDHATVDANIPRTRDAQNKLECAFFMNLWNCDQEAVLTALSSFGQLCEEAEICCGSDELTLMQVVPNYNVYTDLAAAARIGPQEKNAMRKHIFAHLKRIEFITQGNSQAWRETHTRWQNVTKQLISHVSHRGGRGDDNQQQESRSGIRRRSSHHSIPPQEHELEEWQNMTGFLCALGGVCLKSRTPRLRLESAYDVLPRTSVASNGPTAEQPPSWPINEYIASLLKLLVCTNERLGAQIRDSVKEMIGSELDPALYHHLFDQIKICVDRFFDGTGQVLATEPNTMFVEHVIQVMRQVLENSSEESAEYVSVFSIEELVLALIRYVRRLDPSTGNAPVVRIKVQVCRLLTTMMRQRDILSFRQEIRFRNKLVDYVSDWILGATNHGADEEAKTLTRELDLASMEAMSVLLVNLPLQPEEGDAGDIMEAKSNLFLKYFTLFMNLLNDLTEGEEEKSSDTTKPVTTDTHIHTHSHLRKCTIQAMSNLLNANIDSGLTHSIGLGYHNDVQTRAAFIEVLTKILQQGTEFDTLAETVLADRFERLVGLVTMLGDKGELPIAMALANVVNSSQMDELARVFVTLFDAKHLLYQLLWNMFSKEVELADCMQTLFRGNSLASKIMAFCFKMYGSNYLHSQLEPLIKEMMDPELMYISYEVDPARMAHHEHLEENRHNLTQVSKKFFSSIISSVDKFPAQLRSVCHCLFQVVTQRFPQNAIGAVGSAIFLRFINPAIVSPYEHSIVDEKPLERCSRGLKLVSKIMQNIANHVHFKEQHMMYFNDFLTKNFSEGRRFFTEIASDSHMIDSMSFSMSFISDANVVALHRLLWNHQEKMGLFLSSSRDHRAVGRRPFDKMITLLAYIGPPEHPRLMLDSSRWGSMDLTSSNFEELMARRNIHNEEDFKRLKSLNIFYQEGTSKSSNPVFYYVARKYKCGQIDVDQLIYHVRLTLKPFDNKLFEVVLDCTNFGPDNRFRQQHLSRWMVFADRIFQNLHMVYVFNCNSWLRDYIKRNERILAQLKGSRKLVFVESTNKLIDYIDPEQQHLPKSTLALDEDLKVFANALKLSETHRDTKVAIKSHTDVPRTKAVLKVGPKDLQVTHMDKTKVLGQQVLLNDIYHASEIDEVTIIDETQFAVSLVEGRMLSFMHQECEDVKKAIQHIKTRWERSKPDSVAVHSKIRPKDVPGTLLNMALLNLGSDDPNLRSVAYNLLYALTTTFNLRIEGQLLETSGLCIPANNTIFIVSISKTLAANEHHLTLEFLEECITSFSKISIELKHLCLEYMTPWLPNLKRFCKRSDETKRYKLMVVLDKLINMTITEKQMYPSIQAKVWGNIGQVEDLIDCVLDSFTKTSVMGSGQPRTEVMADTVVALASANVKLVSAKVIERLCRILDKTCLSPTVTLEKHLMWDDIVILTRYLLMLSFNNSLDVATNLPALFHIITMLVSTGPLPLRASIHGHVINILHSLCTCSQLKFSDETQKVLHLGLTEFTLPKYYQMFGISKVKSAAVTAFRTSYRERPQGQTMDTMPLTSLEAITDALLEIMEACMKDIPNCKWLEEWTKRTKMFALKENPALQPRAMVVFGCISKHTSLNLILDHIICLLKLLARAVMAVKEPNSNSSLLLIESIVIALTRLQPLLPHKCHLLHKLLFWVAIAVLQLDEVSFYAAGLGLLEQNIHTLDAHGVFNNESPEYVLMAVREPLEEWHFKQMDHSVGLSFKFNFNFALVGHLLKGFRHPNTTTISRTIRILNMMLEIIAKHRNVDMFDVNVESIPYLAALLPVSEEVRSRCSIRRGTQHLNDIVDMDNAVFINLPISPKKARSPAHKATAAIAASAMKPQWSLDSAPRGPPCNSDKSPLKQHKSLDLPQAGSRTPRSVETSPSSDNEKRYRPDRRISGHVVVPRTERKVSTPSENVLLNEEVLTDPPIQALLLTVMATLVRNLNEPESGILYEYLAEASQVFPQVFPIVHQLLDSKIVSVLKSCPNQATLCAVQSIIQNTLASEESPQQQPKYLQSIGFGGLWRFSSQFAQMAQIRSNAELFVNFLEALIDQISPPDDRSSNTSRISLRGTQNLTGITLSSSLSSLDTHHTRVDTDQLDLSLSLGAGRSRHCSANQVLKQKSMGSYTSSKNRSALSAEDR